GGVGEGVGGRRKGGDGCEVVAATSTALSVRKGSERLVPRLRCVVGCRSRLGLGPRIRGRTFRRRRLRSAPLALGLRGRAGGPERRRRPLERALGARQVARRQLCIGSRSLLRGTGPER